MKRKIITYGDYFFEFYNGLKKDLQEKVDYVLELVRSAERVPPKFFKHLEGTDGLFEIRIEYEGNVYRVFSFFDEGNLVILINCFQKKTQKTPANELKLAEKLKQQYFIDKKTDRENGAGKKVKK